MLKHLHAFPEIEMSAINMHIPYQKNALKTYFYVTFTLFTSFNRRSIYLLDN